MSFTEMSRCMGLLSVPTNTLVYGEKYRWNMQSYNNDGWSAISNTLYFQTQAEDEISVSINSYSATPTEVTVGEDVILNFSFTNAGDIPWTFYAALSLRRPDDSVDNSPSLKPITLSPGQSGTAEWIYVVEMTSNWDVVFGVWKESSQVTSLGHTGWLNDYITVTSSSNLYQLPATNGKISYFASNDRDLEVCDPAAWGEFLGESCGKEDSTKYWYCAMRWPYYDPCTGFLDLSAKSWWHNRKILVTNPTNGKQVVLAVKDWGPCNDCIPNCPQPAQERVIDVSETALKNYLEAETDDVVNIEFAEEGASLGSIQSVSIYNRQKAVQYAQKYWNKVTSDGYFFEVSYPPSALDAGSSAPSGGVDCAHFASCCIGKEGHEQGGGLNVPSRVESYGEPGADKLMRWLVDSGNAIYKSSINELEKGDVIGYDFEKDGYFDHIVLYLGDGKISAHSVSYYSKEWDIYGINHPDFDYQFIHIKSGIDVNSNDGDLEEVAEDDYVKKLFELPEEIPGFEVIIVICAVALILFWKRNWKK